MSPAVEVFLIVSTGGTQARSYPSVCRNTCDERFIVRIELGLPNMSPLFVCCERNAARRILCRCGQRPVGVRRFGVGLRKNQICVMFALWLELTLALQRKARHHVAQV